MKDHGAWKGRKKKGGNAFKDVQLHPSLNCKSEHRASTQCVCVRN